MQACPYDAVHIDPDTNTAAKCHFCSHRVDIGLEPSCVVVCPTHAIIAGDLDDPDSEINNILAKQRVTVRKPEQGTAPKLFYINGSEVNLHPTATTQGQSYMFAEALPTGTIGSGFRQSSSKSIPILSSSQTNLGTPLRAPQPQGAPHTGALPLGGSNAEQMVQVGYDALHKVPWHWPVPAYLVTKGISAGIFLLIALASWTLNSVSYTHLTLPTAPYV